KTPAPPVEEVGTAKAAVSSTNLHSFGSPHVPGLGVAVSGGFVYGTMSIGPQDPTPIKGAIYKGGIDGIGFQMLKTWGGENPHPNKLLVDGSTIYGSLGWGGRLGAGQIFKLNVDGTGFTELHAFANGFHLPRNPTEKLVLSGTTLYGITD